MEEWGDGEFKLVGVRAGGGGVLEVRGGELARERGDWDARVPLVLKRMRGREPGLFPELATAAAMWRPTGASGVRGRSGGRFSAREKGRRGTRARRVEGHGDQEVACGPPSAAGGAALCRRQRKLRGREEEDTG